MLPLKSPVVTLKGKSKIYNIYKDKCLSVCLCVCLSVCLSCLSCLNVCLFVSYSEKRFWDINLKFWTVSLFFPRGIGDDQLFWALGYPMCLPRSKEILGNNILNCPSWIIPQGVLWGKIVEIFGSLWSCFTVYRYTIGSSNHLI
jgi:hypothetical protein